MTLNDVLHELLNCLGEQDDCIISWQQIQRWPINAINIFQKAGWLKPTLLAKSVECPGCEMNCFMPIEYAPTPQEETVRTFVDCITRNDMGRVNIPSKLLQQWQLTYFQLTQWISQELNLRCSGAGDKKTNFKLGTVQRIGRIADLHLDFNAPISLQSAGHALPLNVLVGIDNGLLKLDQESVLAMLDLPPTKSQKIKTETKKPLVSMGGDIDKVGSAEWREHTARNAANARHSQPGGSRDKQQKIREIWSTGKYSSRDRCAEEECAALNMSFSAARKALRNTPDPSYPSRCYAEASSC